MKVSRREFLESSAVAVVAAQSVQETAWGKSVKDGPGSPDFTPLPLTGNINHEKLRQAKLSEEMTKAIPHALDGSCVGWGIPFDIKKLILLRDSVVTEKFPSFKAQWLVVMHTSDMEPLELNDDGLISPMKGEGRLGEHIADYVLVYGDGTEVRHKIQRRHQAGTFFRRWGENCFQAVAQTKPFPVQQSAPNMAWGWTQQMVDIGDRGPWVNWLWAWENPHPEKDIVSLRFEPQAGTTLISAVTYGRASSLPLRWENRQKAILKLPEGTKLDPRPGERGLLSQIQLDMGQIISAERRKIYPNSEWADTHDQMIPELSESEIHVEYTAHQDAHFHLGGGRTVAVSELKAHGNAGPLTVVKPATRTVQLRVIDAASKKPVPVRLHVHGESGEYLTPIDHHRYPNRRWFEDYAGENQHLGIHYCVYIPGETTIDLPLGNVYLEVSKGFEIRPIRKVMTVGSDTDVITITLEKVLQWRERGWVTADTHVHFLSPPTATLEGAAEGVNVVNLLASQWGELMTNVGDFDGKTTFGSKEAGGDGEWLVRVGTENRQHVMGHMSLLGYRGNIIAPMCSGGPNEAALGDPIKILMLEWAEKCREQGGLVILPHFPNPRGENAADIVSGVIDGLEMTSWGTRYRGIDPYSLSDYYRYLNCGYFVSAVGGTDKMAATIAVGAVRTYAKIPEDQEFSYQAWIDAVKSGHTFVSYGPLMEFAVEGKPAGSRIQVSRNGGTVDVSWELASVTVPMSRVEVVVNGEIRESQALARWQGKGHCTVRIDRSSWIALMVRGHYEGKAEIIAAHSSPVMVEVDGSEFYSAADALTILEQVEGALAYLDTVGGRADEAAYKRMRMRLTAVYRQLHNEMHKQGHYHDHTHITDHAEHHEKRA